MGKNLFLKLRALYFVLRAYFYISKARLTDFAGNVWKYTPLMIFVLGLVTYEYGTLLLFSLPLFFQIIFRLFGVKFDWKEELSHLNLDSEPNYSIHNHKKTMIYEETGCTGLTVMAGFDTDGNPGGFIRF